MPRVLVFGSFDGLHPGHEAFLREAMTLGEVVVSLPSDKQIELLKGHAPKQPFDERKAALLSTGFVAFVVEGDEELGVYHILQQVHPEIVFFGYDQTALLTDFTAFVKEHTLNLDIRIGKPHEPERYKSSLLNYDRS